MDATEHGATGSPLVASTYLRLAEAARKQGLPPPLLHADGGIELVPFSARRNEPDWNAQGVPRLYPHGFALPEPMRIVGAAGGNLKTAAIRETLRKSPLPALHLDFTALHLAADANNAAAVDALIAEHLADPMVANAFGDTPLHVACTEGSWDAAARLLEANRDALFCLNGSGLSPLGMAALANRPRGVALLARAGARLISGPVCGLANWRDSCELLVAAERGHSQFFHVLEQHFAIEPSLLGEARKLLGVSSR